jgi:hypothetical protein
MPQRRLSRPPAGCCPAVDTDIEHRSLTDHDGMLGLANGEDKVESEEIA